VPGASFREAAVNAIEELLARKRIRQLAVRYALAVDGKDLDGIAALFAAGGLAALAALRAS